MLDNARPSRRRASEILVGMRGRGGAAAAPVDAVAAAHGATAAQIRLACTLAQGPHVLAIPGTGNLEHLDGNVAAAAIRPPAMNWRGWNRSGRRAEPVW
jgi:aryl-alcohol dehydrogenase-like predicted oxidoreductase